MIKGIVKFAKENKTSLMVVGGGIAVYLIYKEVKKKQDFAKQVTGAVAVSTVPPDSGNSGSWFSSIF